MSTSAPHPSHGRPTLAEAAGVTTGADYWSTVPVDRLGLRSLRLADGPHGLRVQDDENPDHLGLGRSLPATCFPPAVTLASTWDRELIEEVGAALGSEARAAGVDVVLGPGLNIKRSPLCGRNFEYFAEDPFLAGTLAAAMVRGIQSTGVAACVKHFAANNQETDRQRVSAQVDERTLREIYLRAFEVVLRESAPWSVMSAYNKINGTYASEDPWLLTEVLRSEWGYDGVVISDWGAVHDPVEAVAAGLDLRMPGRPEDPRVLEAATDGRLTEDLLTRPFDRLRLLAERTLPATLSRAAGADREPDPRHEAHHDLTRRAAAQAAVLLTNDGTLPLALSAGSRVAVVGELARTPRYQGAGSSAVNPTRLVSGLDALERRLGDQCVHVVFGAGYHLETDESDEELIGGATRLAAEADVVVLFLGLPGSFEAEGRDRTSIDLPANQVALVEALAATGTPVVVTLSNGSAVTTHAWRGRVNAVLELWLTGQAHGESVADLLLGDVNPSGKLAETVPVRLADTPSFLDFPGENSLVTYGEGIHVGYRYYDARDLAVDHPFGHGMSYTTFEYSDLEVLVHDVDDAVAVTAGLTITNTGGRRGAEVVQLYVSDGSATMRTPERELRGYAKVTLEPGEAGPVRIEVARRDLAHFHTGVRRWVYAGGPVTVHAGSSSRDLRLAAGATIPGAPLDIPLTVWSTLAEWFADPVAGDVLRDLIAARGGLKGRMADLLADETGRDSVLGLPLLTLIEFPGFPVDDDDVARILEPPA
jgi:beta-glucosidase